MNNVSVRVLMLCLAISGCAAVAPDVPNHVPGTAVVYQARSVAGIYRWSGDGHFAFGPYTVIGIRHEPVWGDELRIGGYSQARASGRFQFALTTPRAAWTARCAMQSSSRSITVNALEMGSEKTGLLCELSSGAHHTRLELHKGTEGAQGTIFVDGRRYQLREYFPDGGKARRSFAAPSGLEIGQAGQNLGGLALVHPGTFWLKHSLATDQQDALAAVMTALLIHARRY